MITCYVHFISAFLHMLRLIFLSIAPTLAYIDLPIASHRVKTMEGSKAMMVV